MIIADTGFWLALANRRDQFHASAKRALTSISEPLVTTWPVMTETCHLLMARLGVPAQLAFMASVCSGACTVFELSDSHLPRVEKLMKTYADLPMDLADASLVILAEDLGSGRILSTDQREFKTYKWKQHKPFKNLLVPAG